MSDDVDAVDEATDQFVADFDSLGSASSLTEYQDISRSSELAADGQAFDDTVRQLSEDLENTAT